MVWTPLTSSPEWGLYRRVIKLMQERKVPFALGGGFALSHYARFFRSTKDMDLYIRESDRETAIACVKECGLADMYESQPYDRGWIYRSMQGEAIVDLIWGMPNRVTNVTLDWLEGPKISIDGVSVRVLRAEDLIWAKIFVLQRGRCDWPDILNILYWEAEKIDWERLLSNAGQHRELLFSALTLFVWMCPDKWELLSAELKRSIPRPAEKPEEHTSERRADMLESRPWFSGKMQPCE